MHLYAASGADLTVAAAAAEAEVRRIEAKYSRYRDDSVVAMINAAAGSGRAVEVDAETAALLDYAAAAHAQSDGAFDITSGVLRRAWDFKAGRVPEQAQIDALLPLVGWSRVRWSRPRIELTRPGMELDFGGFGKEYAADRAAAVLQAHGLRHGLVDLAGDLHALGPHPDGSAWQIGVRHPRGSGAIATIAVDRGGLASSGDYERYVECDGRRYGHVLDPRSGWPVDGLAAVSVRAGQCLVAGTAATVAMLHGAERGPRWLADLGLPHLYVDTGLRIGGSLRAC